ncbi:M16 family metallopeptidase [Sporosarcina ureilytica]|uniref:Peptidase M16 n=1 Tax=Sporosarcina ureilytica TaxID=298596 RepID=A0A1D8JHQ9_9BACL|nr:pitrilysin family protein [Sporosarcina ureilytica]AOV08226.1 peptidase M16 [Sporosarcina ureilytica]
MVKKSVCTNGVRIVHEYMPHVRSVALGVWIQAGSKDELKEEAGLAHFIEHMLFKGTTSRTAKTIAEEFDRIGGELNAFTSKEATCVHTTVLKEHAENALTILEDMLLHSKFDKEEIAKEKLVILEEIAMCEDTPDDDVHEQLWKTMYPDHPIGKPVLGTKQSVLKFTKQSIQSFMNRLYRPENIVISIAGNYDETLISSVERLFGAFKSVYAIQKGPTNIAPAFHSNVSVKEKDIEQAHLCLGFPSLSIQDERKYELAIADCIIGGGMSSRLFQEVREEHGLAYSIYSYYSSYEEAGSFIIYGGTSPENLEALQNTIQSVIQTLLSEGILEEELENAKQSVITGFLLGLESTESRMSRNGHQELLLQSNLNVEEVVTKITGVTKLNVEKMIAYLFCKKPAISIITPPTR